MNYFMKKSIILLLFILGFSCGNNPEEVKNNGKSAAEKIPERIISLSPAITEELYLLGAENRLIANTYYCRRPEAAKHKKKVGNLMNFNIEDVMELKPDLILSTSLANKNKINRLKQLKISVVELRHPKNFTEICDNFIKLGNAIGSGQKAGQILSAIRQEVEKINRITGNLPKKKVFVQIGAKPLKAVNSDYHINDLIRLSGGINIYEHSSLNSFSRESVLLADPDIIIIPSMGFETDEEKKTWEKYITMRAVKNNNIFIVDTEVFCNFGIGTFIEALKISASLLHPEARLDK